MPRRESSYERIRFACSPASSPEADDSETLSVIDKPHKKAVKRTVLIMVMAPQCA